MLNPGERSAEAHRRSGGLVPSTLCVARARGDRVREVCDKRTSAILPRGVVRAGSSNPWTSACYERHSCFLTLPLVHEPSPSTLSCLACMLFVFVCTCCLTTRHISVAIPSKPVDRGSLVKNGLRIVNKTIVVNFACVVIPDVPNKSG